MQIQDTRELPMLVPEAALSAIGLENILKAEPVWNFEARRKAATLETRIRRGVRQFIDAEESAKVGPVYDLTWKQAGALLFPMDPAVPMARATALREAIGSGVIASAVSDVATNALHYLADRYPQQVREVLKATELQTMRPVEPSRVEWMRYRRCWELSCEPESILLSLQEGSLTAAHVECLTAVFPGIMQLLRDEMTAGVMDRRARSRSWDVPLWKEPVIRTLLGQPGDVQGAALIQQMYDATGAEQGQQSAPAGSAKLKFDDAGETASQRAEGR